MNFQQLRMLREVATRGTIAAAADALGYTPSAVSQQLTGLERSTGVSVLERVGRNVRLTDAGRELVRHADDLLARLEAAQAAIERVGAEVRGQLVLTVYESVAATLLLPTLDRLAERYPDLQVRTWQLDPDVAIDALASGEIDLAFTVDYPHAPEPHRDDIVRFSLVQDHFRIVVAEDDPVSGPSVALADLAGREFITSPAVSSCGRCVVVACRDAGFEPTITHQIEDYPTALRLVTAGKGVALIPDLGLVHKPDGVRVVNITPPVSRTIQLACRAASVDRPAIRAVHDTLVEVVADLDLTAASNRR